MGQRPAEDELFVGNMGSIQREIRTSMQREDKPTMETGLERIAAKARSEPKLRFTSLAHHITRERVWTNLCQIPKCSAPGEGEACGALREEKQQEMKGMLCSVAMLLIVFFAHPSSGSTVIGFGGQTCGKWLEDRGRGG